MISLRNSQFLSSSNILRMLAPTLLAIFLLGSCAVTRTPPATPPSTTPGIGNCSTGQEFCQGRCVDTITFVNDSQNCGRCGNQCSFSETCTGGFCGCAAGSEMCMGQCVNSATFMSDSQNCGRCGNSCAGGESCFGGTCRKM